MRRRRLGVRVYCRALEAPGAETAADAGGLLFRPFLMGARGARSHLVARGVCFGLTEAPGGGALVRSIMEGVAYEVRACLGLLEGMGLGPSEVIAVGGGARSRLWTQIFANVIGRPVGVPRQTDAASLGAMLLAAEAIGRQAAPDRAAHTVNPIAVAFDPDPSTQDTYQPRWDAYMRLYETLRPVFRELAASGARGE